MFLYHNAAWQPGLYPNTVQAPVSDDEGGLLHLTRESEVEISDVPASLSPSVRPGQACLSRGQHDLYRNRRQHQFTDHVRIDTVVDDKFGNVGAPVPQPCSI
ncbi:MAG: hypothetical protein R3E79_32260 [Caldilineaceae bacterium]